MSEVRSLTDSVENHEERLQASDEDKWISVRTVSQHLFCSRAGVITHEGRQEDSGFEGRPIRLGYLPRYDLREIEAAVGKWLTATVIGAAAGTVLVAMLCLAAWLLDPRLIVVAAAILLALGIGAIFAMSMLFILVGRLTSAKQAQPDEPEFTSSTAVFVDWWGLRSAGFELQEWPGLLKKDNWRLSGKPWAVLVRGRQRIPVFFDTSDRVRLEKKHYARMAAYCLLLESEAQVESPFGVILRPGSTTAEAIPSTAEATGALADGLEEVRKSLASVAENRLFVTPATPQLCAACPLGKLQPIDELPSPPNGVTRMPVDTRQGPKDSVCGSRFQWIPPHKSAVLQSRA